MPKNRYKYATQEEADRAKMIQDMLPETKGRKTKMKTKQDDISDDTIDKELDDLDKVVMTPGLNLTNIEEELLIAKLDNLKSRTEASREKSSAFRKKLWNAWTEKFMSSFEEAFGIYKNDLISLHLDATQVAMLNTSLERAISKLEDVVQSMCKTAKVNDDDIEEESADD